MGAAQCYRSPWQHRLARSGPPARPSAQRRQLRLCPAQCCPQPCQNRPGRRSRVPCLEFDARRREYLCTRKCAPGAGAHQNCIAALPRHNDPSSPPLQFPASQTQRQLVDASASVYVYNRQQSIGPPAKPVPSVHPVGAVRRPLERDNDSPPHGLAWRCCCRRRCRGRGAIRQVHLVQVIRVHVGQRCGNTPTKLISRK